MTGPGAFWYSGAGEAQLLATVTFSGTAALTVAQPTIAGTGELPFQGTAALSVTAPSIAATGSLVFAGTAALSVTAPSIAGAGTLIFVGTGALSVPMPSVAGTGTTTAAGFSGDAALLVSQPLVEGLGTVTVPSPVVEGGTGGPKPSRRFVLDLPHKTEKQKPERTERRARPIRVALELTAPLPVLLIEASVAEIQPITASVALAFPEPPRMRCTVRVMNPLGLAYERISELEAVIAAVMED